MLSVMEVRRGAFGGFGHTLRRGGASDRPASKEGSRISYEAGERHYPFRAPRRKRILFLLVEFGFMSISLLYKENFMKFHITIGYRQVKGKLGDPIHKITFFSSLSFREKVYYFYTNFARNVYKKD